jgi:hypothetical protein
LLRTLGTVVNLKSVLISALAFASTLLCLRFGIVADFPLTLIATAIVFPLVFSISTAPAIKAHGRALYLAARDWLDEPQQSQREAIRETLRQLLAACRDLFTSPKAEAASHEAEVYRRFSELSVEVRQLRAAGLGATEISRCNPADDATRAKALETPTREWPRN